MDFYRNFRALRSCCRSAERSQVAGVESRMKADENERGQMDRHEKAERESVKRAESLLGFGRTLGPQRARPDSRNFRSEKDFAGETDHGEEDRETDDEPSAPESNRCPCGDQGRRRPPEMEDGEE